MSLSFTPLLSLDAQRALPPRAKEIVEYRKSGLSLNHIQGCPLDCAYCIRHTYGLWDHRQPLAIVSDEQAVSELLQHRYFQPHLTPIQIFNRATDPFLPQVKEHLFSVLKNLDDRDLQNHILVITRYRVEAEDCVRLNRLKNLKLTLLFTYSGISDSRIEPVSSDLAINSMKNASSFPSRKYRVIFYFRPIVPGLNDGPEALQRAAHVSQCADAAAFSGLFFRDEIAQFYKSQNLPFPYDGTARRKILPNELEERVITAFKEGRGAALFRKTSCAVAYAHGIPDYNGHYGVREICDICPRQQIAICQRAHRIPSAAEIAEIASRLPEARGLKVLDLNSRAVIVDGLPNEQPRYFLQHHFGFQFHDAGHPHKFSLHGRADIGWER